MLLISFGHTSNDLFIYDIFNYKRGYYTIMRQEHVNRVDPINLMRVIAAMMVFLLHCTLFEDNSFFNDGWTFVLRTPAWGGYGYF